PGPAAARASGAWRTTAPGARRRATTGRRSCAGRGAGPPPAPARPRRTDPRGAGSSPVAAAPRRRRSPCRRETGSSGCRPCRRGRGRPRPARGRQPSGIQARWVAEHRELRDVAAEEKRGRPVGDDAQLPREERQLVEVVRAGHEPAEEAGQLEAEHLRDALVAPERGDLAEHPVAVLLLLAGEVL